MNNIQDLKKKYLALFDFLLASQIGEFFPPHPVLMHKQPVSVKK
jgi:hypothetical protein